MPLPPQPGVALALNVKLRHVVPEVGETFAELSVILLVLVLIFALPELLPQAPKLTEQDRVWLPLPPAV